MSGMEDINWPRVAATVRHVVETKAAEAKNAYPFLSFYGGAKNGLRRALGIADKRTFEARWVGATPYTMEQLVRIADLLGVRVADLLITHHEDPDEEQDPGDGALPNGAPNPDED